MTGTSTNDEIFDEQLFEAIRDAYRDVHLPVPLADIRHPRRTARGLVMATRTRMVFAAAVAVAVVSAGTWLLLGRTGGGVEPMPADPSTAASTETPGKPARPTSSATTDAGRCADYGQAELDASGNPPDGRRRVMPPLRLTLSQGETRLLLYGTDDLAVTCWLSGDLVVVAGTATAVNATVHPPGELSYGSEDSGRGWGGAAFGRVPAGTTRVTISFPSGPDAVATIVGEWFGYLAPPGPDSDRLAVATTVTAVTPTGTLTLPIQHG